MIFMLADEGYLGDDPVKEFEAKNGNFNADCDTSANE